MSGQCFLFSHSAMRTLHWTRLVRLCAVIPHFYDSYNVAASPPNSCRGKLSDTVRRAVELLSVATPALDIELDIRV